MCDNARHEAETEDCCPGLDEHRHGDRGGADSRAGRDGFGREVPDEPRREGREPGGGRRAAFRAPGRLHVRRQGRGRPVRARDGGATEAGGHRRPSRRRSGGAERHGPHHGRCEGPERDFRGTGRERHACAGGHRAVRRRCRAGGRPSPAAGDACRDRARRREGRPRGRRDGHPQPRAGAEAAARALRAAGLDHAERDGGRDPDGRARHRRRLGASGAGLVPGARRRARPRHAGREGRLLRGLRPHLPVPAREGRRLRRRRRHVQRRVCRRARRGTGLRGRDRLRAEGRRDFRHAPRRPVLHSVPPRTPLPPTLPPPPNLQTP